MCGIGGMLGQPDETVLQRMNSLQQHRGPDANDVWLDERVGFAHARLAIVDLDASRQPMIGVDGSVLVVNGEIYNHRELRADHASYPFTTAGDSEAILALHAGFNASKTHPPTAAEHATWIQQLDGMYAFALWNPTSGQLLLARDPLGIKPLVRTRVGDTLLFSSEVKALRADERYLSLIHI